MKPEYTYTVTRTTSGEEVKKMAIEAAEDCKGDGNYEMATEFYAYANGIDVTACYRHVTTHKYYAVSDRKTKA